MRKLTYAQAINEALSIAMEESDEVITYGLGVPDPKGVFSTTLGLQEKFGPENREMRQRRIAREQEQRHVTRGARGKFVLILKRGRITDVLYVFVFVDHDLAFDNNRHAFDRMVASFKFLN